MSFNREVARRRRHERVRNRVEGSPERPRLCVYRSNQHIYAQIIDDTIGHTLVSASSLGEGGSNVNGAIAVGKQIAEKAKAAGIEKVVFDRGGYLYHGRIKSLADAAREGGLDF